MKKSKKILISVLVLSVFAGLLMMNKSVSAYSWYGYKWNNNTYTYYIDPTNGQGLDPDLIKRDLDASAQAWPIQGQVKLNMINAGFTSNAVLSNDGKNNIMFRNDSNTSTIGSAYTWWYGGYLVDADIVFHENYKFLFNGMSCSGGVYLQDIATHEFGHAIGLTHSTVSSATMYPTMGYCSQVWRTLDPDDIEGVRAIYPSSSTTAPQINLSPNSLSFTADVGTVPAVQSSTLTNTGNAPMNWIATSNQSWCRVSPTSGSLAVGAGTSLSVNLDPMATGGSFTCDIAISDFKASNNPQYLRSTYTVRGLPDSTLPTVSITFPSAGAIITTGKITIQAQASDISGIAKVEFYIDNKLVSSDISSPYSYVWNVNKRVDNGNHTIMVKAYDKATPANTQTSSISVTKR